MKFMYFFDDKIKCHIMREKNIVILQKQENMNAECDVLDNMM